MLNLCSRSWARYTNCLQRNPILTKFFVSSGMFAVTDVTVQYAASKQREETEFCWNVRRTFFQMAFGGYYGVVHAHFIWGFLERSARSIVFFNSRPLLAAVSKVLVDQFVTGTPLFNTVFYYMSGRGRGLDHTSSCLLIKDNLMDMLVKHWSFWIPFHCFNFYFIPFQHRIIPPQVALLGWSAFMSVVGYS